MFGTAMIGSFSVFLGGGEGVACLLFHPEIRTYFETNNKAGSPLYFSGHKCVSPFTGLPSESEQLVRLERVRGGDGGGGGCKRMKCIRNPVFPSDHHSLLLTHSLPLPALTGSADQ